MIVWDQQAMIEQVDLLKIYAQKIQVQNKSTTQLMNNLVLQNSNLIPSFESQSTIVSHPAVGERDAFNESLMRYKGNRIWQSLSFPGDFCQLSNDRMTVLSRINLLNKVYAEYDFRFPNVHNISMDDPAIFNELKSHIAYPSDFTRHPNIIDTSIFTYEGLNTIEKFIDFETKLNAIFPDNVQIDIPTADSNLQERDLQKIYISTIEDLDLLLSCIGKMKHAIQYCKAQMELLPSQSAINFENNLWNVYISGTYPVYFAPGYDYQNIYIISNIPSEIHLNNVSNISLKNCQTVFLTSTQNSKQIEIMNSRFVNCAEFCNGGSSFFASDVKYLSGNNSCQNSTVKMNGQYIVRFAPFAIQQSNVSIVSSEQTSWIQFETQAVKNSEVRIKDSFLNGTCIFYDSSCSSGHFISQNSFLNGACFMNGNGLVAPSSVKSFYFKKHFSDIDIISPTKYMVENSTYLTFTYNGDMVRESYDNGSFNSDHNDQRLRLHGFLNTLDPGNYVIEGQTRSAWMGNQLQITNYNLQMFQPWRYLYADFSGAYYVETDVGVHIIDNSKTTYTNGTVNFWVQEPIVPVETLVSIKCLISSHVDDIQNITIGQGPFLREAAPIVHLSLKNDDAISNIHISAFSIDKFTEIYIDSQFTPTSFAFEFKARVSGQTLGILEFDDQLMDLLTTIDLTDTQLISCNRFIIYARNLYIFENAVINVLPGTRYLQNNYIDQSNVFANCSEFNFTTNFTLILTQVENITASSFFDYIKPHGQQFSLAFPKLKECNDNFTDVNLYQLISPPFELNMELVGAIQLMNCAGQAEIPATVVKSIGATSDAFTSTYIFDDSLWIDGTDIVEKLQTGPQVIQDFVYDGIVGITSFEETTMPIIISSTITHDLSQKNLDYLQIYINREKSENEFTVQPETTKVISYGNVNLDTSRKIELLFAGRLNITDNTTLSTAHPTCFVYFESNLVPNVNVDLLEYSSCIDVLGSPCNNYVVQLGALKSSAEGKNIILSLDMSDEPGWNMIGNDRKLFFGDVLAGDFQDGVLNVHDISLSRIVFENMFMAYNFPQNSEDPIQFLTITRENYTSCEFDYEITLTQTQKFLTCTFLRNIMINSQVLNRVMEQSIFDPATIIHVQGSGESDTYNSEIIYNSQSDITVNWAILQYSKQLRNTYLIELTPYACSVVMESLALGQLNLDIKNNPTMYYGIDTTSSFVELIQYGATTTWYHQSPTFSTFFIFTLIDDVLTFLGSSSVLGETVVVRQKITYTFDPFQIKFKAGPWLGKISEISQRTFYQCTFTADITLPSSVIPQESFFGVIGQNVIPQQDSLIYNSAFRNAALTFASEEESTISCINGHEFDTFTGGNILGEFLQISNYCFQKSNIVSINIGQIQVIPIYCFYNCALLESIQYATTLTDILQSGLGRCVKLNVDDMFNQNLNLGDYAMTFSTIKKNTIQVNNTGLSSLSDSSLNIIEIYGAVGDYILTNSTYSIVRIFSNNFGSGISFQQGLGNEFYIYLNNESISTAGAFTFQYMSITDNNCFIMCQNQEQYDQINGYYQQYGPNFRNTYLIYQESLGLLALFDTDTYIYVNSDGVYKFTYIANVLKFCGLFTDTTFTVRKSAILYSDNTETFLNKQWSSVSGVITNKVISQIDTMAFQNCTFNFDVVLPYSSVSGFQGATFNGSVEIQSNISASAFKQAIFNGPILCERSRNISAAQFAFQYAQFNMQLSDIDIAILPSGESIFEGSTIKGNVRILGNLTAMTFKGCIQLQNILEFTGTEISMESFYGCTSLQVSSNMFQNAILFGDGCFMDTNVLILNNPGQVVDVYQRAFERNTQQHIFSSPCHIKGPPCQGGYGKFLISQIDSMEYINGMYQATFTNNCNMYPREPLFPNINIPVLGIYSGDFSAAGNNSEEMFFNNIICQYMILGAMNSVSTQPEVRIYLNNTGMLLLVGGTNARKNYHIIPRPKNIATPVSDFQIILFSGFFDYVENSINGWGNFGSATPTLSCIIYSSSLWHDQNWQEYLQTWKLDGKSLKGVLKLYFQNGMYQRDWQEYQTGYTNTLSYFAFPAGYVFPPTIELFGLSP